MKRILGVVLVLVMVNVVFAGLVNGHVYNENRDVLDKKTFSTINHKLEKHRDSLTIDLSIPIPYFEDRNGCIAPIIKNWGSTSIPYLPSLPSKTYLFEIPQEARDVDVHVETNTVSLGYVKNIDLTPLILPSSDKCTIIPPEAPTDIPTTFPTEVAHLEGIKQLRERKLAMVSIYPIQYNTETYELIWRKIISIKIGYSIEKTDAQPTHHPSPLFEELASEIIYNYKESANTKPIPSLLPGVSPKYIIITTPLLEATMQPLANWKTQKGVPAEIYNTTYIYTSYTGNDNQEKIRNFIKYMYNTHGIEWVLLAGDHDTVPPRIAYANIGANPWIPTDYYYADLTGTWDADGDHIYGEPEDNLDWLPDVYVGRLPTNNIDAMTSLIQNILNYEKNPPTGTWYKRAVLCGAYSNYDQDDDGGNLLDTPKTDEAKLKECIRTRFIPTYFIYDRLYEKDGLDPSDYPCEYPLNESNTINRMSVGESIVNWAGHGSEDKIWREVWSNDLDGDGLSEQWGSPDPYESSWYEYFDTTDYPTNGNMRPLVYADACHTGAFNWISDCLGEHVLKNIGIGFVGASEESYYLTGWDPGTDGGLYNQGLDYRFWEQFFNYNKYQPARALYDSKVDYLNDKGLDPWHATRKNFFDYNLLGCPEIPIWTDVPGVMKVTYPSIIKLGPQYITVTVKDNVTGNPISGAMVCLQNSEIYEYKQTDGTGTAILNINPTEEKPINVTATIHNYLPHLGNITKYDTTKPISSVDSLPLYENTTAFTIDAIASDENGTARVELWYNWNNTGWLKYGDDTTSPWSWNFDTTTTGGDGGYLFYSRAYDIPGNYEDAPTIPDAYTIVDATDPISNVNALPTYETTTTFTVTATASDLTGIQKVELWYNLNGGGWLKYSDDTASPWSWNLDTTTTGGDGVYQFYSRAYDNAGNYEDAPVTFDTQTIVDTTNPTSNVNALTTYKTSTTFTITATASDLTGIQKVELWYNWSNTEWLKYGDDTTSPWSWEFNATTEGEGDYQFYSRAYDNVGNYEDAPLTNDTQTTVDTTKPISNVNALSTYKTSKIFTITANASDINGIQKVELWYKKDGGSWALYDTDITAPWSWEFNTTTEGDGNYEFYSRAYDIPGNYEDAPLTNDTQTIVDTAKPTSNVNALSTYQTTTPFTITATASDINGIQKVELWYKKDGGSWTKYGDDTASPWSWSFDTSTIGDGYYQFYSRAYDNAGNYEDAPLTNDTQTIVDTTKPTTSISSPSTGSIFTSSSISISWSGSDATSNIDHYEIKIDSADYIDVGLDTNFTFTGVSDGSHTIYIKCVDKAGNEEEMSVDVKVDTNPFSLTGPYKGLPIYLIIVIIIVIIIISALVLKKKKRGKEEPMLGEEEAQESTEKQE